MLESVSYRRVLARGYAVVHGAEGLVTAAGQLSAGQGIELEFDDGRIGAQISSEGGGAAAKQAKPRRRTKREDEGSQGSLL